MPKIIEAIYENGVFKPLEKVELREGERLNIKIKNNASEKLQMFLKGEEKF